MAGKKIKGRKRHIVVDTMGNLLAVYVHAANLHDTTTGAVPAINAYIQYPTIKGFCGDAGYRGTFEREICDMLIGVKVDISERIKPKIWMILPKRWVVERTFGWMIHSRRLSKDYEYSVLSAESMLKISHINTLLRRLC